MDCGVQENTLVGGTWAQEPQCQAPCGVLLRKEFLGRAAVFLWMVTVFYPGKHYSYEFFNVHFLSDLLKVCVSETPAPANCGILFVSLPHWLPSS